MANKTLPKVQLTPEFRTYLEGSGPPPDAFAEYFAEWVVLTPREKLADPYFGSDSPYERPTPGGMEVLQHVHMSPKNTPADLVAWNRKTRNRQTKTSDAVLIYARAPLHGYLLIHMVVDPGAHEFCNMSTPEATRLMNEFANIAEEFVFWGRVSSIT